MSLWEYQAVVGGYLKANATEDDGEITASEAASLAEIIDQPPVWH